MVSLDEVPGIAIAFIAVAAVVVAGFLVLDGLSEEDTLYCVDGYTYNSSADNCYLNTNHSVTTTLDNGINSIRDVQSGMFNTIEYAPTWGTIIGVAVILSIVIGGLFVGYGYGKKKGWL